MRPRSVRATVTALLLLWAGCISVAESEGSLSTPEPEPTSAVTQDVVPWASSGPRASKLVPREIGTPGPLVLERVDPDGRWVAFCQARLDTDGDGQVQIHYGMHGGIYGDALVPYLDIEGTELELDAFVDATADGRWVVVLREGRLELHDIASSKKTALGPAPADDPNPLGGHRAAVFSSSGDRLLYVRGPIELPARAASKTEPSSAVVVRELTAGTEHAIEAPRGVIARAGFFDGGTHVWSHVVSKDTDGDGKLAIPRLQTSLSSRGCRGPIMSYSTGGYVGDDRTLMIAERTDRRLAARPDAIGVAGGRVFTRDDTGAVWADGDEVAPASCDANVLYANAETGRVAYACRGDETVEPDGTVWAPLFVFENGRSEDMRTLVAPSSEDYFQARQPIWRAKGERQYDLEHGALLPEPSTKDLRLAEHGTVALFLDAKGKGYLLDEAERRRHAIDVDLGYDPDGYRFPMWREGSLVTLPLEDGRGVVLDLSVPELRGFVPSFGSAMASSGEVLSAEHDRSGIPRGPLKWHVPAQ